VVARVKEVVLDDANEFNCRAQHCASALGCVSKNEQQNAGSNKQIFVSITVLATFISIHV